ncbi:hypothetical protein E4U60_007532 [Claviceps pazoutovae]|uniref:Uncharacterized protein n=1 Tax=Claviceps pazoutovae TaxID=1649127 RepID=A0A9P7SCY5_9HYPO|nr:hypothetical protein E4U60_007532 [Claviceps pazoutovae]
MITSTPHKHSGTGAGADETEMYLDDCMDFEESLSISPASRGSERGVDMPPAGTKFTTARSTPKSLPQMQSTISHDSGTRSQSEIKTRRPQSRILKTKTHLEGSKEPLSEQETPSSLPPPSKQTKERWEMQAMSKMPSAGTKVTTASTPKSLPQIQSTISHDSGTRSQSEIKTRRPQSRILKTKTHLEGSKQTKERWETQAMSKNR